MYQAPQPHFPNYSPIPNPNPNSAHAAATAVVPYPVITSQPALLPPGTHSSPYRPQTPDPCRYPGIQFQPAFHPDPNAVSQDVAVSQPDPNAYPPAINSLAETPMNMLHLNYINRWMSTTTGPRKFALLCEVCSIYCDTKDVLENHMLGKRHKKNLQIKMYLAGAAPTTGATPTTGAPPTMGTTTTLVTIPATSTEVQNGGLGPTVPAASMILCTICNVTCNSQATFDNHLVGKRHAKASARHSSGPGPVAAAVSNPVSLISTAVQSQDSDLQKSKIVQSVWCELCNISCDTSEVFNVHKLGKKHSKNLEKSKSTDPRVSTGQPATTPIIGPGENPEASKGKTLGVQTSKRKAKRLQASEDIETKKRKMLEGGAEEDCVRACTMCNVVCNSPAVFHTHIVGHKHIQMLRKQAESGVTTPGPQAITAS